jgi:hypothetical protein
VCVGWKGERREEKKEERKEREFDMVRVEKCVLWVERRRKWSGCEVWIASFWRRKSEV